jgi:hypothetical protein
MSKRKIVYHIVVRGGNLHMLELEVQRQTDGFFYVREKDAPHKPTFMLHRFEDFYGFEARYFHTANEARYFHTANEAVSDRVRRNHAQVKALREKIARLEADSYQALELIPERVVEERGSINGQ